MYFFINRLLSGTKTNIKTVLEALNILYFLRLCCCYFVTVLPDGIFSNQKSQFGKILESLAMEEVDFRSILSILRPNGIFYGHLVHFVVCCTEKNLATPALSASRNREIS
jgi:hypothetical protein